MPTWLTFKSCIFLCDLNHSQITYLSNTPLRKVILIALGVGSYGDRRSIMGKSEESSKEQVIFYLERNLTQMKMDVKIQRQDLQHRWNFCLDLLKTFVLAIWQTNQNHSTTEKNRCGKLTSGFIYKFHRENKLKPNK